MRTRGYALRCRILGPVPKGPGIQESRDFVRGKDGGVRIQISIRHGHLAADSQEKIKSKLEKLARFHDRISAIDATVDVADEACPKLEVTVTAEGVPPFVARAEGSSLLGTVETAVHRLEEQLRRHKEKIIDSHRENYRRNRNVEGEPPNTTDASE